MHSKFIKFDEYLSKSERILIICHKGPDGDTLGSAIAFKIAMDRENKFALIACADPIPERFNFLPEINNVVSSFDFREFDLIVVMDSGASYMTKFHDIYPDIFSGEVPVVNVDHHASNDNFGICNIVDDRSASTTIILFNFFEYTNRKITPFMATALITGIYNDTGSFMHANTSLDVFEVSAKLMFYGAKITLVARKMFKNTPVSTLRLWGRAMENVRVNDDGVTVSVLTTRDFEEFGVGAEAVSGVVDLLNSIPDSKYVCLLNEDSKGNVKGSFRTQSEDVDLDELASKFGGGGHRKAAGFTMPGRIHQEVHWKIIPEHKLPDQSFLPKP